MSLSVFSLAASRRDSINSSRRTLDAVAAAAVSTPCSILREQQMGFALHQRDRETDTPRPGDSF